MARIVTNSLLLLFLVSGCGWLSKEEVQAPKAPEPTPAPVSSEEAASDRPISAAIAEIQPSAKRNSGCCKLDLKRRDFMWDPSMG